MIGKAIFARSATVEIARILPYASGKVEISMRETLGRP